MYNNKVMQLFKKPKHAGSIKNADGIGEVINPSCGDSMRVFIKVKNNKISRIKVQTMGCVVAIASSEALASIAEGKSISDAEKIKSDDVVKYLGKDIPQEKVHCSVLAHSALKKAIEDFKGKNSN